MPGLEDPLGASVIRDSALALAIADAGLGGDSRLVGVLGLTPLAASGFGLRALFWFHGENRSRIDASHWDPSYRGHDRSQDIPSYVTLHLYL